MEPEVNPSPKTSSRFTVESVKDDKMPGEELEPRRRRSGQFILSALQAQASGSHVSRPPVLSAIGKLLVISSSDCFSFLT